MSILQHRKLSLTAFALVAALASSFSAAAQEPGPAIAELPTAGSCTSAFSFSPDEDARIPAQMCGPCILDFCADVYVRCSFSHCALNDECCVYSCQCDHSCTTGGTPARVCLPLVLPDPSECIECGNDVCEIGEDCESCPDDCEGKSKGPPSGRFCCGNGEMEMAEGDGTICDGNY